MARRATARKRRGRGRARSIAPNSRQAEPRPGGEKTWRFWTTIAATVLIFVVGVLIAPWQSVVGERAKEHAKDEQLAGQPALLPRIEPIEPTGYSWIFENELTDEQIAKLERIQVVAPDGTDVPANEGIDEITREAEALGGQRVEMECGAPDPEQCHGVAPVKLRLTGNREHKVQILDIRARVLRRQEPPRGGLLYAPPQGGDEVDKIHFDLDSGDNPRAYSWNEEEFAPYLDANYRYLERGEPLVVGLYGKSDRHVVEWEVEVMVTYQGKDETIVVRSDGTSAGTPFRTIGWKPEEAGFRTRLDFDLGQGRFVRRQ